MSNHISYSDDSTPIRRPHHGELERVVGHFLYYLSNDPDPKTGISDRTRFFGECPVEAKMLFPGLSNDTLHKAVDDVIALRQRQANIMPGVGGSWRGYK